MLTSGTLCPSAYFIRLCGWSSGSGVVGPCAGAPELRGLPVGRGALPV
jgi:hypothetical protein